MNVLPGPIKDLPLGNEIALTPDRSAVAKKPARGPILTLMVRASGAFGRWRGLCSPAVSMIVIGLCTGLLAPAARAASTPEAKPPLVQTLCETMAREAELKGFPASYFARLIWKESLFDPAAVSPKGAQGIAQFMPTTAQERGLANPFEPVQALIASAILLSELKTDLGNLGLAAAAYNAGKDRVRKWLDGHTGLPAETLDYVLAITGRPASDWTADKAQFPIPPIGEGEFMKDCVKLASRGLDTVSVTQTTRVDKAWGAQLAGAPSTSVALRMFEAIRSRHRDMLGEVSPMVVRKRNPGMGPRPISNIRIGYDTRLEAEAFCSAASAKGIACVALRN